VRDWSLCQFTAEFIVNLCPGIADIFARKFFTDFQAVSRCPKRAKIGFQGEIPLKIKVRSKSAILE
jgi:hypothetical protein